MTQEIVNRVAQSNLITIDLGDFYPKKNIIELDIKPWLFQGLMLKEKDYREQLKKHDWSQYNDCIVHVNCSADAIIPNWAWMLITTYLLPNSFLFVYGSKQDAILAYYIKQIDLWPIDKYTNQALIVKGCGDKEIPNAVYLEVMKKLVPVAKSIMFGEPCSTVPVYKKAKK